MKNSYFDQLLGRLIERFRTSGNVAENKKPGRSKSASN